MRTWLLAVAGLVVLGSARSGWAQEPGSSEGAPIPTQLLRVLAEAARDFHTGRPVWLVARTEHPARVVGNYVSADQAQRAVRRLGRGHRMFGPYITPRDSTDPEAEVVDSVVVFSHRRGEAARHRLDPGVDALFLTRAAAEKFLIPYYSSLYGPAFGAELAARVRPPTCHFAGTIFCHPGWPTRPGWPIDPVPGR